MFFELLELYVLFWISVLLQQFFSLFQDKLMTIPSEPSGHWLFKNKDHGKASAAASLVCVHITVDSPVVII